MKCCRWRPSWCHSLPGLNIPMVRARCCGHPVFPWFEIMDYDGTPVDRWWEYSHRRPGGAQMGEGDSSGGYRRIGFMGTQMRWTHRARKAVRRVYAGLLAKGGVEMADHDSIRGGFCSGQGARMTPSHDSTARRIWIFLFTQ